MLIKNDFSFSTIEQVSSICQSFFKEFKVISFNYAKIYHDNGLLAVHSDPGYAELYLQLSCPPIPTIPLDFWQNNSFYYLPKNGDDATYNELLRQSGIHFNCDDPLFFVKRMQDYTEVAVFCSVLGDKYAVNRYLNYIKEFTHFVEYFREETNSLFQQGSEERLYLPPGLRPNIPEAKETTIITSEADYTNFYKRISNKGRLSANVLNHISQREMQCLYYLCKGYRYKDIGNQLSISDRTVETHITNARNKLNIATRSKMIKYLLKFID